MAYQLLVDYWLHNMSDTQIAAIDDVSRTAICHKRRYHKIPSRINTGRTGELKALQLFKHLGFDVVDMNLTDKTAGFDILLDGKYRIDVKSARITDSCRYNFQLTNKPETNCRHRKIGNRTRKDYAKECDFFLFICIEDDNYYLIPSEQIDENVVTLAFGRFKTKREQHKIKSRQDVLTAITKLDTSIIAQHPAVEKSEHMRTDEIVFESERKIINLIRGAIKTRGLTATYSVNNDEQMDVRIGYSTGIKKYLVDLTDAYAIETFQLELQEKIKLEDAL